MKSENRRNMLDSLRSVGLLPKIDMQGLLDSVWMYRPVAKSVFFVSESSINKMNVPGLLQRIQGVHQFVLRFLDPI